MELTDNSLATLLLCSTLARDSTVPPLTDSVYEFLARELYARGLEPSDMLSMDPVALGELAGSVRRLRESSIHEDLGARIFALLRRRQPLLDELLSLDRSGIRVFTRADRALYPASLICKFRKAGIPLPPVFYFCGDPELLRQRAVAVVGSRKPDDPAGAERFIRAFVASFVAGGYMLSSGGARGADSFAAAAARDAGGSSVITVSDSLLRRSHAPDAEQTIRSGRCLYLSLVHPREPFQGCNAMRRNKIIYALSDYALVAAADCHIRIRDGQEIIDYSRGGTWVGAHECYRKHLSALMVRSCTRPGDTPRGNQIMLETLKVLEVPEARVSPDPAFFASLAASCAQLPDTGASLASAGGLFPEPLTASSGSVSGSTV